MHRMSLKAASMSQLQDKADDISVNTVEKNNNKQEDLLSQTTATEQ